MSAKFDYAEAERAVKGWEEARRFAPLGEALGKTINCAELLPAALQEIRRLLGVVHEAHQLLSCGPQVVADPDYVCEDCLAWRATTKETM